jgi:hypothetical protein
MRILTAQEFIKEPYGTVYIQYTPEAFIGQPKIKSEPRGEKFGSSWRSTDVLPWVKDDEEFDEQKKFSEYELQTEGFCTDDAIYNHDDNILYLVFNKEEVQGMIDRLVESLYTGEKYNKSK